MKLGNIGKIALMAIVALGCQEEHTKESDAEGLVDFEVDCAKLQENKSSVELVTFNDHVEPLVKDRCLDCHTTHPPILDTLKSLKREFAASLASVKSGAMPRSGERLEKDQVLMLERWAILGFPKDAAASEQASASCTP